MIKKLLFIPLCLLSYLGFSQDTCSTAVPITAGLHTVSIVDGTQVPAPICTTGTTSGNAGEWFTYTATQNYQVTITTDLQQNSGGDTRFHVYTGDCNNLVCYAGDDDAGDIGNGYLSVDSFEVQQGITYYIAFDDRWQDTGFDFLLTESAPPPPPPISFTNQTISTDGNGLAIVDMNGDHLDDIVAINGSNVNIQFQLPSGGFTERNIATPAATNYPSWSLAAADYNDDGYTDLLYGGGSGVTFMRANIDASALDNGDAFDDVNGFTEISTGEYVFSQRSNFADINNDGNLDAFVCHDVEPNVYYINDGSGNLSFIQGGLGDYASGGNYGSIWIDYDNDNDLDMFIAKCGGEEARRMNQMHTNNGDGTFTENAADIGLADPMQTWSAAWGDFDNDGDMDVMVGASSGPHKLMQNDGGLFTDVTTGSGLEVLGATSIEHVTYDLDNDGNLDVISGGNVLRGHGDMTFTLYSNVLPGGGAPYGDLNNDGFIDAFAIDIYMNDGNSNNWVTINTVGTTSNSHGIGARVEVHTADGVRIRDVRSGEGFRYMSTMNTHVGLGTQTAIDNIIIYWPSGIVDTYINPDINVVHTYVEGETLGLPDTELTDLKIYPNPVGDQLHMETTIDLSDRIATVFDINGKRVLNSKLTSNSLEVSRLESGMYLLQLETDGKTVTKKFIKK
jgi:hypothetical protein